MNKLHLYNVLSHIATWAVLFLLPLTFTFGRLQFPARLVPTIGVIAVFYIHYFCVAKFYMKGHKALCWIASVIIVATIGFAMHNWMGAGLGYFFNLAVATMIATSMRIAMYWQKAEEKRLKAEKARVDAELDSLRFQTNPHFLLNTLNNIYALTTFDTSRAQEAIQQLAAMLRHILYDTRDTEVSVESEVEFLKNYVELMKIRYANNIDLTFDTDVETDNTRIAPLILIPLVENAFKHGVSEDKPSFIHITFKADSRHIDFLIENSNHQKGNEGHSGHGIGLEQVYCRLELAYRGHYDWQRGLSEDKTMYRSHITIPLHKSSLNTDTI